MSEAVNKQLAMKQWENLKSTFTSIGVKVDVIENSPGLVDQVFCANCAVVWGGKALTSTMFNPPRRSETEPTIEWFKNHNFQVMVCLIFCCLRRLRVETDAGFPEPPIHL